MSHSSQDTKPEYANKHESNITSKMANIWERKIGSDLEHKPSPTTVLTKSVEKVEPIRPLTKTASTNKVYAKPVEKEESIRSLTKTASTNKVYAKPVEKEESIRSLTKTASTNKSDPPALSRKNTREMVQTFERMASNSDMNNFGVSGLDKNGKKGRKSGIPIRPTERKANVDNHDELKSMMNRICRQMNDLNGDINRLKQKIDAL